MATYLSLKKLSSQRSEWARNSFPPLMQKRVMWEDQKTAWGAVFPTTRMREYGNVSIPQEAFIAALRMGEE